MPFFEPCLLFGTWEYENWKSSTFYDVMHRKKNTNKFLALSLSTSVRARPQKWICARVFKTFMILSLFRVLVSTPWEWLLFKSFAAESSADSTAAATADSWGPSSLPVVNQVWSSLTQLYSVVFSQSRIGVKKCVSTKVQSRFASVVSDDVLGPLSLAQHSW